ncbi:MAG: amino acid adenylation domain-containing protein, partial [Myxococcaceae bacterium]|nr:amino acid adenylation domain-containing protein [Myxococcaceae bacterium]
MSENFDPFAGPALVAGAPTTESQREIWASSQLGPDANLAYNESVSVTLEGPLDVARLESALRQLVQRHEVLRSTFSHDGLTLIVAASADIALAQVDLTGRPDELEGLTVRAVSEPFDLEKGPLVRVQLAKLSPAEHVLVFTAHHIVVDGWSFAVLIGELAKLYSGRELPAAASFVEWARRAPDRSDEAWWLSRCAGELPVLELPSDHPRPALKTWASRRHDVWLDDALVARLKKAGAKQHASLFAVLLAGWKGLLTRLTGQEDVVVGVPTAGQANDGWESLAGHCVNMLPLRTKVDLSAPAATFVADVRRTLLDAQSHPHVTLGQLLTKLPIARDPSRLPLVNVVFNVDRGMGSDAMPFCGLTATLDANPRRFETYDVFVNAVDLGGRVRLECQYNSDLYEPATIRRWLSAYERLLTGLCDALEQGTGSLGDLDLLGPEDRAQLDAWNREAELDVDPSLTVVDLLEAQATKTPNAVAVECDGARLTYAELHAKADALAAWLQARGAGRGKRVGLSLERGVDLVVAIAGVLKSGAAYVPLDPGYPAERLKLMREDAGIDVVLEKLEGQPAGAYAAKTAQPADPAYVIYTSGSTGRPKGVELPHRAVVNLLKSVQRTPGLAAEDTVLAVTTLSFDIAVSELILPLTVGAKIVIATREVASDGARLLALLRASNATFLDATPATYRMLIDAGWQGGTALTKCICTGEAMPATLAAELVTRVPSVWNGYGPTETCVWSTFWEVKAPVSKVLIGKPVANTEVRVLDARGQPVLPGVVGELWLSGRGVALGYLNRPELTAERFVNGAYRTGDLVRQLADGSLECLGRNDSQVKVRGYRIELGEIEDALQKHPAVRQAAVAVRGERLAAWVVLQPGHEVADAALREHLKRTLPDFMVPALWARLERMPLTPSGKVDKKALPEAGASATPADAFVAPRTPTEQQLAGLWQEVLGVGRVSATDDFFALGGHS